MAQFKEQEKEVWANLERIKKATEQIEKQHSTAVMSVNEEERQHCAQTLEALTATLTQASTGTRVILRKMGERTKELEPLASHGSGSLRARKQHQQKMVDDFTKVMKTFKKMQEKYNKKYQSQLERQVKIVKPDIKAEEMARILEDPEGARQMMFDIGRRQSAQEDLNKMKDRYEDVKKIGQSIAELQQMFLEMDEMITQQGDILNRIEVSVDKVENYTEDAKEDLSDAVESQKSIMKKKWVMAVLIVFLILLLLVVIAYIIKAFGLTSYLKKKK